MSIDSTNVEAKRAMASAAGENSDVKSELKEIKSTKLEAWKYVGCGVHTGKGAASSFQY